MSYSQSALAELVNGPIVDLPKLANTALTALLLTDFFSASLSSRAEFDEPVNVMAWVRCENVKCLPSYM